MGTRYDFLHSSAKDRRRRRSKDTYMCMYVCVQFCMHALQSIWLCACACVRVCVCVCVCCVCVCVPETFVTHHAVSDHGGGHVPICLTKLRLRKTRVPEVPLP